MKTVVITGSTRGIGLGLADAFLQLGCNVMLNGRLEAAVDKTLTLLHAKHGHGRVLGYAGDVTRVEQMEALWSAAHSRFGQVDIWINNAGISHVYQPVWKLPAEWMGAVVNTNLLGTMYGSQVALRGMLAQGFGHIYNMEGFGGDGRRAPGGALYGATQSALRYFTRSLSAEAQDTPVKVSTLSPGLVVTELWAGQYVGLTERWERAKRMVNLLGDRVETVAPYLAQKVLANDKNGARIVWLTPPKIMARFLIAGFNKRDLFSDDR